MDKIVITFAVDISSSVDIDNRNKDALIIGEGPTQGIDDRWLHNQEKDFY